jgi:hypothetical protein
VENILVKELISGDSHGPHGGGGGEVVLLVRDS